MPHDLDNIPSEDASRERPENAAMEAVFTDWWLDNDHLLEAGFPANFDHLRRALNAAFANASNSAELTPSSRRNCCPASANSVT